MNTKDYPPLTARCRKCGADHATQEPFVKDGPCALTVGGYGVHCACGYYWDGFGPDTLSRDCYGARAETLTDHFRRDQREGPPGLDVEVLTDALNAVLRKQHLVYAGFVYGETGAAVVREYDARLAAARTPKEADQNASK